MSGITTECTGVWHIVSPKILCQLVWTVSIFVWSCQGLTTVQVEEIKERILSSTSSPRLAAPWVVGIFYSNSDLDSSNLTANYFRNSNATFTFVCSGTIVGAGAVITGAKHLFTSEGPKWSRRDPIGDVDGLYHRNFKRYIVAAGLPAADLRQSDEHTQFVQINLIREHPQFNDDVSKNVASVVLKSNFDIYLSPYVKAVKILYAEGDEELQSESTKPGQLVLVAGFNSASRLGDIGQNNSNLNSTLHIYSMSITEILKCQHKFEDKRTEFNSNGFCASLLTPNDLQFPHFLYGAGVISLLQDPFDPDTAEWTIFGVYASHSSPSNYSELIDARSSTILRQDLAFFSRLGTEDSFSGINVRLDLSTFVCRPTSLHRLNLSKLCDGQLDCANGFDESFRLCYNQQQCSETLEFRCQYGACVNSSKILDGRGDCADFSDENPETALDRSNDPRLKAPWVASIFFLDNNSTWRYLCGGTITSSYIVITSSKCVLTADGPIFSLSRPVGDPKRQYHLPYHRLKVVAGLLTNRFESGDKYSQYIDVGSIREHPQSSGMLGALHNSIASPDQDLAAIRLKTELTFDTPFVQKVSLIEEIGSVEEKMLLETGVVGVSAGFNIPFNSTLSDSFEHLADDVFAGAGIVLQSYTVIIKDFLQCRLRFYQADSDPDAVNVNVNHNGICAQVLAGSDGVPCELLGAGLVISINPPFSTTSREKRYLLGVYSQSSRDKIYNCSTDDLSFYARIGATGLWTTSAQKCDSDFFMCQNEDCRNLDEICDGNTNCEKDGLDESYRVCFNQAPCSSTQFRCAYGACIDRSKVCDGVEDCPDASDETPRYYCKNQLTKKKKKPTKELEETSILPAGDCPPLEVPEGVQVKCPEKNPNCTTHATIGTQVILSCAEYYKSVKLPSTVSKICRAPGNDAQKGIWTRKTVYCDVDCGVPKIVKRGYVANGVESDIKRWPWHAILFRKVPGRDFWAYICGGSLVSRTVILTASHCVLTVAGVRLPEEDFMVVLGASSSNLTINQLDSDETQILKVKKIVTHPSYNYKNFESDVALVQVEGNGVTLSDWVQPICYTTPEKGKIDILDGFHIQAGKLGQVVGFGLGANNKISPTLIETQLPIQLPIECDAVLDKAHASTQFCAGYTNGTSLCPGDSGGGMYFDQETRPERRYYVQGIVSHGHTDRVKGCNIHKYAVFTKVSSFRTWITKEILKLDEENEGE